MSDCTEDAIHALHLETKINEMITQDTLTHNNTKVQKFISF